MRICYLIHNLNPKTGWGRYASDLIYGVENAGHEVIILKEEEDGFNGVPILRRGIGMIKSSIRIRNYLKNCDIIHAMDVYPYGVSASIANTFINKKFLITALGTYSIAPFYNIRRSLFSKYACTFADMVVTISNFTKKELLKKIRVKRIKVINPGIDLEKFYQDHIDTGEKFILSVGSLKYRKGYHISIPAFVLAKKTIPNLKYKIVGSQNDHSYFRVLKRLVKKYDIENDVEFLDNITDKELTSLYQSAKLFILTSVNYNNRFEGFGIVFLEAVASGLPVLGTFGNGIEDAVKNNYNGLLVQQNNIEAASEAIINILSNSKKWEQMNKASYVWAKEHDISRTIDDYLSVYNSILNK